MKFKHFQGLIRTRGNPGTILAITAWSDEFDKSFVQHNPDIQSKRNKPQSTAATRQNHPEKCQQLQFWLRSLFLPKNHGCGCNFNNRYNTNLWYLYKIRGEGARCGTCCSSLSYVDVQCTHQQLHTTAPSNKIKDKSLVLAIALLT